MCVDTCLFPLLYLAWASVGEGVRHLCFLDTFLEMPRGSFEFADICECAPALEILRPLA